MKHVMVRIDLGDGDWALVIDKVLRVTHVLHEAELRKCLVPVDPASEASKADAVLTVPEPKYVADLGRLDMAKVNAIFILNQTAEWSLGPVTQEVLDKVMTREQYKVMVKALDGMYVPDPLANGKGAAAP